MDSNDSESSGQQTPGAEVDLERLADKVYKLMQEELRLEAARGGSTDGRRRK